ncbi:MAG: 1,4-alpha-glucan branching enzyme [Marinoscillum sp.]|jgi:1,4-alpha-glucan branching enzyme
MKKFYLLIFFIFQILWVSAQSAAITPTIQPDFFSPDEQIEITYDVTGNALSGLSDAYLWLWLPDNTSASIPSNVNPANTNATATNPAKFTKVENGGQVFFKISITLTDFTSQPKESITKVGILLKGNDWSDGQTTDFVFDITSGYALKVVSPIGNFKFYNADATVKFDASASESSEFTLYHDDVVVTSVNAVTQFDYSFSVVADGAAHELYLEATNGTTTKSFKHAYVVDPQSEISPIPSGLKNGANYKDGTSLTLVLTAPNKSNVYVLGDFNDWSLNQAYLMKKDGEKFWIDISGLTSGKEYLYQYLIDGKVTIADPYTNKVISSFDDGQIREENRYPNLIAFPEAGFQEVSVINTAKTPYNWTDDTFQKPAKEKLVIYELLVRDFTEDRSYRAVIDRLDYLDSLGINAIELMPVNEFEGNLSWGYNPSFKLAVDKFYGTENDLKELVDKAHSRGIAVILDMVMNHHFGRSPLVKMDASGDFGPPTSTNPWFNVTPKHDFNVGYDFNHESQYTKEYLDEVVTYWTREYHVDGYRFDLSKGFTQKNTLGNVGLWGQYDASRVAILERMADVIWEQDPETYVILEHLGDNSEEKVLADYGMMLWGHMNSVYRSTAKGNASDIGWLYHGERSWSKPHVVGYMESHDEERVMWDLARSSKNSFEDQMNRLKLNAAFFFLVPGPKMVWQFGEFGYDVELNDDRLAIKPTKWEYLEDKERLRLFATYQSLINLKTKTDLIDDANFTWEPEGSIKWINYGGSGTKFSVFGNFSKTEKTGNPHFVQAGDWYDYFTGEKISISDPNEEIELRPGEFYIYTSEIIENFIAIDPVDFLTPVVDNHSIVKVYPNPSSDFVTVSSEGEREISILDLTGKTILHVNSKLNNTVIDISTLDSGVYMVKIHSEKGDLIRRLVKD